MSDPSLLNIPYRFKASKLYSQIPDSGLGDFVVSRSASNAATRVNAQGFIETVADNVPRLDYPIGGISAGCPALLVEPAATNLVLQSEEFNDVYWAKDVTTVSANTSISPNGLMTADLITASGSVFDNHDVNRLIALTGGTTYTVSCFFKKGTTRYAYIGSASSPWTFTAILDLDTGLVASVTAGATADAVLINGFYRLRITATATSSASARIRFGLTSDANSRTSLLTTSDTISAWGAQLETGSVATSYIPTTTAAITRGAETISKTGVSSLIGQTEGTIYAEFRYLGRETTRAGILFLRQTSARGLSISLASNVISFSSRNTSGTSSITLVNGLTFGTYYKIAIAYDANGTAAGGTEVSGVTAYVNGSPANVSVGDLRVPDATITEIRLYGAVSGSDIETANANIRAAALYTTRLTNAQLQALTT